MNYNVQLNNGQVIELKDADIDVVGFTATLNSQQTNFVKIGEAIVNKHIIQAIFPVATEQVNQ